MKLNGDANPRSSPYGDPTQYIGVYYFAIIFEVWGRL